MHKLMLICNYLLSLMPGWIWLRTLTLDEVSLLLWGRSLATTANFGFTKFKNTI